MSKRNVQLFFTLLLVLLIAPVTATAQSGVVKYLRWNVNLSIQPNSGITVEEIHEVSLVRGITTYRRVIPTARIEGISNIGVLQLVPGAGQRAYQQAGSQADYTFTVSEQNSSTVIDLFFPANQSAATTFVFRYFVVGALGFYETGDKLMWQPFGDDLPAAVDTSTTVVKLPGQFSESQVQRDFSGLDGVKSFFGEKDKATFVAANVPAGASAAVTVVFPHGVVQGAPPQWQTLADWTPTIRLGSVALGLLTALLSAVAVGGWWFLKVRGSSAKAHKAPNHLKTPPGALTPAVAGALLDGKVAPRHLAAGLVSLAGRGAMNVAFTEKQLTSFLPAEEKDDAPVFELYGLDQQKAETLLGQSLYGKIFGFAGGKKRELDRIRQILFMAVPELKGQIELDIVRANLFVDNLSAVRRQYLAFGGAAILLSVVLALLAAVLLSQFTYLAGCSFLGFVVGALTLMGLSYSVPKTTKEGAKQAAQWLAFKRYLSALGVKEAAKNKVRFAELLPYAVAFGLEKEFVAKFAAAAAPIPRWWGKPVEKSPNVGHTQAHAWVSAGYLSDAAAEKPGEEKKVIRRLADSMDAANGGSLADIKSELLLFLAAANEAFAKTPPIADNEAPLPLPQPPAAKE